METDAAREFFLERKYARFGETLNVSEKGLIQGYASLFGQADHSGDIVQPGAYALTLRALDEVGQRVKMLWQHDPTQPIGVWDEVREDERGLRVRGRLLDCTQRGREAAALIEAGAGLRLVDDAAANHFPMPCEVTGREEVLVGRIRRDLGDPSGRSLSLFIVGDQLLKGAALNAVQIAETVLAG